MRRRSALALAAVGALGSASALTLAPAAVAVGPVPTHPAARAARHVLLLSVDGMHQSDLARYAVTHPTSALASLTRGGVSYDHASTPFPSDSFPGMVGQVTGGNPRTTGVYYDVSYNHALLPAGTTSCAGATPGAPVAYDESLDKDRTRLDAGQGLAGLPGSILSMTGHPSWLINTSALPVDPVTCQPVMPHSYLQVNTIFDIVHRAGLRTAWSDKHAAYEILGGPSGHGIDDLFTPEINSDAPAGGDWTSINSSTQQYDGYKVTSVLNEIAGLDHSGTTTVGVPAVFGMNFQSVSTAEKLPLSDGAAGGYLPGGEVPGPVLSSALDFVDASVASMLTQIRHDGLAASTTVILSAKHGQSPTDPTTLTRIDDGAVIAGLNADWKVGHPAAADLVTFSSDDDGMLLWLSDRSPAATRFVKQWLLSHPASGNTVSGATRTLAASGLARVYAGAESASYFGVSTADPRHPDVVGVGQHGVVYTGGTKKIAEHGGADPQDRIVPLVVTPVSATRATGSGKTVSTPVETTQIAPTILALLGLNPRALDAVRIEGTPVLSAAVSASSR
ncbi:alkaline phosphatase family protein [Lapillicoccus sp.]|uniref:alkaline phosphatase family protein n=1 Tax=Lapillicoccus sp. TaxID=1909287 RepID=UPI0025DD35CA|nr:alkaline phosphatase family protein [Lapillicoccus sp.]